MLRKTPFLFSSKVKTVRDRFSSCGDGSATALLMRALPAALAICLAFTSAARLNAQNPATSVAVDANANQHPINPNIYGVCFGTQSDVAALNAPLNRFGGNNTSDYNWQQDAINLDFDWYFESYLENGPPVVPGKFYDDSIQDTYNANVGSEPMITIPMLPYIAKVDPDATPGAASLWSFSIAKYGAQVACGNLAAHDPYQADAGSGCLSSGGDVVNDPTDAYVSNSVSIEMALVQHLVSKWGDATNTTGIKYYILDNEPSLWGSTHRDVHPNPETYDEEYNNIVAYAAAIRAVDPNAKIVGPEEWSWWAMYLSGKDQANGTGSGSDYATHNNTYYYPYLLQRLYAYQQSTGTKLIDVLSVHCYSDAGSNFNVATRELWDPNYHDPNWYADGGLNGGVLEWIPLMKQWVNQYYPGLEIGCTEYNWGNETTLVGATTQADVEGLYGVYGFDLATRWTVPANPGPTYLAMQIYRNYDGNRSAFGDTSVTATVANPDNLSAFAALRTTDNALTVMVINKQTGSTPVTVSLANFSSTGTAQAYQVSSATQTSISSLGSLTVVNNSISTTVPSQSITLFVVPSGSVLSAPTTPTGLAANVGNGTVTLTWNAGGGATSYTVSRGSASAGPFTPIGTVTSPAPTTLTDSGLTNGNTYYYVVSGTNGKGTSPNSAPVAATPMVPPAFTSSATSSPNPVTQNSSTAITATVQCTSNSLSNGTVEIIALDPSGNVALSKSFSAQSYTTNQSQTYTASFTPTVAGTYTLEVGVFSASGQQWSLNTSAGTITVNSALSFSDTTTANPTSITVTGSSAITVKVKDTGTIGLTNGIVQMLIIDPSNNQIVQQNWTGQNFTAGGTLTLTYTFNPASLSPPATTNGAYIARIGVFDSSWSTDYYWNNSAATITLTGGSGPPAFTSSGTAKPASITASGSSTVTFSVQDTGGAFTNANVEIEVFNSSNASVGYQVYSGQNFTANGTLSYTFTWTPSGQSPAVTATGDYAVEVGVFDSGWTKDYYWNSNLATITITAGTAPAAPAGLSATAGNASVALSWTASSGATSYNVYRGTTAGGESTTAIATGITAVSYTDSTVANGTKYYYKVAAVNGGGTSGLSNEASATPEPPAPPAPIGLSATAGNSSVTLGWSASSGATSYNVYRGTTTGGESTTAIATGITAVSYTDSTAVNGTTYYYKVTAVNGGGASGLSNEASATPEPAISTPATPIVTVTPGSANLDSGSSINVKVAVTGSGATPTGTVTLSGGGYTTTAQTLTNGSYTFMVPPNSLSAGSDTLTVTYSGDSNYTSGSGNSSISVAASVFSLAASAPSTVAAGSPASSTVTVSTTTAYSGSVSLTCVLTSSPSGASNLPACSGGSSTITLNAVTTTGTATVAITSTSAGIAMEQPSAHGKGRGLAAGGALLAFLILLRVPARRSSWRLILGVLVLIVAMGSLNSCGGNISYPSPVGQKTTAGSYTFTVSGIGNPPVSPVPTTTFVLTIQ
jgi:fibronectin type 3 domain-containing protein